MSFAEPNRRALLAGHVDHGESSRGESLRAAILLFGDLEAYVTRAELHGAAPHQEFIAALERLALLVDRFGEAVELRGLGGQVGLYALAGIDPIPPACGNRAVVEIGRA